MANPRNTSWRPAEDAIFTRDGGNEFLSPAYRMGNPIATPLGFMADNVFSYALSAKVAKDSEFLDFSNWRDPMPVSFDSDGGYSMETYTDVVEWHLRETTKDRYTPVPTLAEALYPPKDGKTSMELAKEASARALSDHYAGLDGFAAKSVAEKILDVEDLPNLAEGTRKKFEANPDLADRLGIMKGKEIYYNDVGADLRFGVRPDRRNPSVVEGTNDYGQILSHLAGLSRNVNVEQAVPDLVVRRLTPEMQEREDLDVVRADRPLNNMYDRVPSLDFEALRERAEEAGNEKETLFRNPFSANPYEGIFYVETQAEAVYYGEKLLQGRSDWRSYFDRYEGRPIGETGNTVHWNSDERAVRTTFGEQWRDYVRSAIRGGDLEDSVILGEAFITDDSYGRRNPSRGEAPTFADVLARYVATPDLLRTRPVTLAEAAVGRDAYEPEEPLVGKFSRDDLKDVTRFVVSVGGDRVFGKETLFGEDGVKQKINKESDIYKEAYGKFAKSLDAALASRPEKVQVVLLSNGMEPYSEFLKDYVKANKGLGAKVEEVKPLLDGLKGDYAIGREFSRVNGAICAQSDVVVDFVYGRRERDEGGNDYYLADDAVRENAALLMVDSRDNADEILADALDDSKGNIIAETEVREEEIAKRPSALRDISGLGGDPSKREDVLVAQRNDISSVYRPLENRFSAGHGTEVDCIARGFYYNLLFETTGSATKAAEIMKVPRGEMYGKAKEILEKMREPKAGRKAAEGGRKPVYDTAAKKEAPEEPLFDVKVAEGILRDVTVNAISLNPSFAALGDTKGKTILCEGKDDILECRLEAVDRKGKKVAELKGMNMGGFVLSDMRDLLLERAGERKVAERPKVPAGKFSTRDEAITEEYAKGNPGKVFIVPFDGEAGMSEDFHIREREVYWSRDKEVEPPTRYEVMTGDAVTLFPSSKDRKYDVRFREETSYKKQDLRGLMRADRNLVTGELEMHPMSVKFDTKLNRYNSDPVPEAKRYSRRVGSFRGDGEARAVRNEIIEAFAQARYLASTYGLDISIPYKGHMEKGKVKLDCTTLAEEFGPELFGKPNLHEAKGLYNVVSRVANNTLNGGDAPVNVIQVALPQEASVSELTYWRDALSDAFAMAESMRRKGMGMEAGFVNGTSELEAALPEGREWEPFRKEVRKNLSAYMDVSKDRELPIPQMSVMRSDKPVYIKDFKEENTVILSGAYIHDMVSVLGPVPVNGGASRDDSVYSIDLVSSDGRHARVDTVARCRDITKGEQEERRQYMDLTSVGGNQLDTWVIRAESKEDAEDFRDALEAAMYRADGMKVSTSLRDATIDDDDDIIYEARERMWIEENGDYRGVSDISLFLDEGKDNSSLKELDFVGSISKSDNFGYKSTGEGDFVGQITVEKDGEKLTRDIPAGLTVVTEAALQAHFSAETDSRENHFSKKTADALAKYGAMVNEPTLIYPSLGKGENDPSEFIRINGAAYKGVSVPEVDSGEKALMEKAKAEFEKNEKRVRENKKTSKAEKKTPKKDKKGHSM